MVNRGFLTALFIVLAGALAVTGCAAISSPAMDRSRDGGAALVVAAVPGVTPGERSAVLKTGTGFASLGPDENGHVSFADPGRVLRLDADAQRPGGKYFTIHDDGTAIYALWWQKQTDGSKDLHVRVSHDRGRTFGPLTILDSGNGVLMPHAVASDGKGRIVVAYYDERRPKYQIYLNRSDDFGRTWLGEDLRLDAGPLEDAAGKPLETFAVEPKLIAHDGVFILTWKEKTNKGWRTLSRASLDGGASWAPEVEIEGGSGVFTAESLVGRPDGVYLVGFAHGKGLISFRTRDGGRTWEDLGSLEGSIDVAAISQVSAVAVPDGLAVVFTYEQQGQKNRIFTARVSAAEGRWAGAMIRVDRAPFDASIAMSADIAAVDNGVIVAWEDYRHILPSIYGSWSLDGGATWSEPRALSAAPGYVLDTAPRLFSVEEGGLGVLFDRYLKPSRRTGRDLYYLPLDWRPGEGLVGLPEMPPDDITGREKRLRERAEAFWKLRVEGRHGETYEYYDPVYRDIVTRKGFSRLQGNIVYNSAETLDQRIWSNIGRVRSDVEFEVPEIMIQDETINIEPTKERFDTEWVWVQGDWYLVFKEGRKGGFLRY